MCNCKNIIPQTQECYDQMILVDIPEHMAVYKQARLDKGLSGTISIDPCIFEEIKHLWSLGISTGGSCCGHNTHDPMINVLYKKDIELMLELGYVQEHWDPTRKDTFRCKSV